ncbi:MAG: GDP-mannose 4,6-dehydratase, partial [Candidatus Magasanikbacteria bacterium]
CLDNFFTGQEENIEHLLDDDNFDVIKHDIREKIPWNRGDELDRIYHLACPASPVQYRFDPIFTMETGVEGTQNVLELARKTDARVLYSSTSEAYGDPKEHPQSEDYFGNVDQLGKRACYDESKRAAETLCKDYAEKYDLDTRIVRIFNTYGPRMNFNDGRVISNFILQALLSKDLTVHGTGEQTRSFIYIDDQIRGLRGVMEVDLDKPTYSPFNIGNSDERSIISVAEKIKEKTNSESEIKKIPIEDVPERKGDPKQRCPDISKINNKLGWSPQVSFEQGIEKTIENFRSRLENRPRIPIFVPTFLDDNGPAESAVEEIIEQLPEWEFDIITSKFDDKLPKEEHKDRVHIFRLGSGSTLDKFLLPIRGALFARKRHNEYNYKLAWAVMASYGALSAVLFSVFSGFKVPVLLSVFEGSTINEELQEKPWRSWIYKLIFRNASKWQIISDMTEQQKAWLEDEEQVQILDFDSETELLAKRTKEAIRELEILSDFRK